MNKPLEEQTVKINTDKIKQKVKVTMSIDLDILVSKNATVEEKKLECEMFANNYVACFGDKDIKIEGVELI